MIPAKEVSQLIVTPSRNKLLVLILIAFIVKYFYLATGLSFAPELIIDRYINPRDYTFIKKGTGYINYLNSACLHALIFYNVFYFLSTYKSNRIFSIFTLGVSCLIVFGGGGKQNILWILIYWIFLATKLNPEVITSASSYFYRAAKAAFIGGLAAGSVFILFQPPQSALSVLEIIVDYQQESFYSSQVISDFEYSFDYTFLGLYDTLIAIIPRGLWPGKPLVGYYQRFWRDVYQADTVEYHTTTYGFLAEAYFMFGQLGPLIYGCFSAFFVVMLERAFIETSRLSSIFIVSFLTINFYFFVRGGYLGFQFWYVLIVLVLGTILLIGNWQTSKTR